MERVEGRLVLDVLRHALTACSLASFSLADCAQSLLVRVYASRQFTWLAPCGSRLANMLRHALTACPLATFSLAECAQSVLACIKVLRALLAAGMLHSRAAARALRLLAGVLLSG